MLEILKERLKTTLYPFQRKGVKFVERHGGRALICDEMGTGKTIQAIAWAVLHPETRPIIVVCPATIKYNWQREWKKHAGLRSHICSGRLTTKEEDARALENKIEELKDRYWKKHYLLRRAIRQAKRTLHLKQRKHRRKRREVRKARILIVNYDILQAWVPTLLELQPRLLILDEIHFTKSRSAKRTKAAHALAKEVPHIIGLSGTPISGRPVEFFSALQMVRPKEFPSYWSYCFKFCGPTRNRWGGGWDFSGTSNLDLLRKTLKGIMIRRLKKKVLKELPKKTRTILPVDIDNRKEYEHAEQNFLSWLLKHKGKEAFDRAARAEAIVRLGGLKLLAAQGKLRTAIQWIEDWLEGTDQKLIVFAIHRVILSRLKKEFPKAMVIDGSVSSSPIWKINKHGKRFQTSKRQEQVDRFQNDPKARLLFGQLRAAGIGLNLTSASNVLFLELGWTPGEMSQAEDRVLRIGQKNKVNIYYMVGQKTIELKLLDIIQAKDEIVARLLDGRKGGVMKLLQLFLKEIKNGTRPHRVSGFRRSLQGIR